MARFEVLITLRIPEQTMELLTDTARTRGQSRSALVREMITRSIEVADDVDLWGSGGQDQHNNVEVHDDEP